MRSEATSEVERTVAEALSIQLRIPAFAPSADGNENFGKPAAPLGRDNISMAAKGNKVAPENVLGAGVIARWPRPCRTAKWLRQLSYGRISLCPFSAMSWFKTSYRKLDCGVAAMVGAMAVNAPAPTKFIGYLSILNCRSRRAASQPRG
jgi:hypothetical protein